MVAALTVLSELLSSHMSDFAPLPHLPALIRALSSALCSGRGMISSGRSSVFVEVEIGEELFR